MSLKKLALVLFLASLMAVFIRSFVFETVRITTPAMSESQPIGNKLIVEKWSIGARLPLSIGLPFCSDYLFGYQTYLPTTEKPYRLPGFGEIKRNDILAFSHPMIDGRPLDRHPILLSRCVGLPGELVKIQGSKLFINDEEIDRPIDITTCYQYSKEYQKELNQGLEEADINQETYLEKDSAFVYLTKYEYYTLAKGTKGANLKLTPCSSSFDERSTVIPYKDFRIELNERSFMTWGALINRYEGVKLVRSENGGFRKNGKEADCYVFKQDYYWLLNDHQGYLEDSRSFGLIPKSLLIGKARLVLFSPTTKRLLQKI